MSTKDLGQMVNDVEWKRFLSEALKNIILCVMNLCKFLILKFTKGGLKLSDESQPQKKRK